MEVKMEKIELVEKDSPLEESVKSMAVKEISKQVKTEQDNNYGMNVVENDKIKINTWFDTILL